MDMETRVLAPEDKPLSAISEVILAFKSEKLSAKHDKQSWGDWIVFEGKTTVVSIESIRGLAGSATIEEGEGEEETVSAIIRAFRNLKWDGEDEDGRYCL